MASAGRFTEFSNHSLGYSLGTVDESKYLHDGNGNRIIIRGGISFSSNGLWAVTYSSSVGGYIRINTVTRQVLRFSAGTVDYNLGFVPDLKWAISDDGNTVVLSGQGQWARPLTVFDVADCAARTSYTDNGFGLATGCRVRSLQSNMTATYPGFVGFTRMRFTSDGLGIRAIAQIHNASTNTDAYYDATLAVAGYQMSHVSYLALGDSFSSGEGEVGADGFVHYIHGTNTTDPKNLCHTSDRSYPYLVAQALGVTSSFQSVACSGAKVDPYYSTQAQYRILSALKWLPGTNAQSDFITDARPDIITISMIGNDIGFSDKIQRCLEWVDACFHFKEDRESIANEIYGKFDTLVGMYEDIQSKSGGARVYVLGYPQLMSATGVCEPNTPFDPEERAMARGLVTYLNAVIKAATERSGVQYIDVENAFAGHQLCEPGTKAVNGLTNGEEVLGGLIPIGNESFHPNSLGHQLFTQVLLEQSNNFTKPMPVLKNQNGQTVDVDMTVVPPYVGSEPYKALMGNAPSGGVYTRAAYTVLSGVNVIVRGVPFVPEQIKQLLKPSSVADMIVNSDPVKIGTLTTDADGVLTGQIIIPEDIDPGFHTLHIYAQDVTGQEIDLNQTIYVVASPTDYDGDGIPND